MNQTPVHPQIAAAIAAASFTPSNRAIRARNAFWAIPGISLSGTESQAMVAALAPSESVSKLINSNWTTPGFQDWFLSPAWEAEEAQRLLHMAMGRVAEVLMNEEESSPVLAAAKEAREIHKLIHGTTADKFADAEVGRMTKRELEEYIKRNSSLIGLIK